MTLTKLRRIIGNVVFLAIFLVAGTPQASSEPVKISMAVTDVAGLEELTKEFGAFSAAIEKNTGIKVELYPITSRTAAVEALKFKRIDLVLAGPAEYVVIRKRTQATPLVGLARPDYFSGIIVLSSSGITEPSQLEGKKIGLGDVGSTSYYLAPLQLLSDIGIDSSKVKKMHLSKHVAWQALKRGQVDAIGMNHERFSMMRGIEKELEAGAFRVVARGPDLPYDVVLVGKHVEKDVVDKLRQAFVDHSKVLIDAILKGPRNVKYKGMKFITSVKDSDYEYVRKMYVTAGYPEYSEFIGEG